MLDLGFFFFNDTATTEIYTLSLHDALPIWDGTVSATAVAAAQRLATVVSGCRTARVSAAAAASRVRVASVAGARAERDRKSTRLNSSHANISYAVFCL